MSGRRISRACPKCSAGSPAESRAILTGPQPLRPFEPDDRFFRLIPQVFIDSKRGRISPGAFSNTTGTDEMSVDWALLSTAAESQARWPRPAAVGQFTKQLCDDLQQSCGYQPLPENLAHCAVVGRKPESVAKRFARATRLVLWPEGWAIPDEINAPQ